MMTVLEYAIDVNKTVEEILKKCKELNIDVTSESDLLDDTAITELDNTIDNTEELEDEEIENNESNDENDGSNDEDDGSDDSDKVNVDKKENNSHFINLN